MEFLGLEGFSGVCGGASVLVRGLAKRGGKRGGGLVLH